MLTSDTKDFQATASYLLNLAQRAEQLFNESDEGLRQKLSYILNNPFRTVVETKKKSLAAHNSNMWCSIVDAFQTSALAATSDYKLKHLVELFSLSGNLLDA